MDVVYKRIPDSLLAILARPLLITARGSWDFQIGDLSDRIAPRLPRFVGLPLALAVAAMTQANT